MKLLKCLILINLLFYIKAFWRFPDSNSDYISMYAMTFSKVLSKKAFKVKKKANKVDEGCCDTIF